ncbi:acyltransferase family protein [Agromyces mediolanus]|uniref:acyltransferase n=1 Tax=Agromyces mediolanus TaxID=41986 RepID=UPI003834FF47
MLRVVSIVGVVAIHTFSLVVTNPENAGAWQRFAAVVLDLGFVWAVPVFVMLSGALVLRPSALADGVGAFYRKRALRLVPALIAWHLIYFLVVRLWLQSERPSLREFVLLVIDGKVYTQLYFFWIILGLYLVAPIIGSFVNQGSPRRPAVFAAFSLAWCVLVFAIPSLTAAAGMPRPIAVTLLTFWVPYVGYFAAGYALSLRRLPTWLVTVAGLFALGTITYTVLQYASPASFGVLNAVSPVSYYAPIVTAMSLAVFVCVVGALDRVRFGERTRRAIVVLSNAAFGVFLVHLLVLAVIRALFPAFTSGSSFAETALLFAIVAVTSFAITIGALKVPLLRRIF